MKDLLNDFFAIVEEGKRSNRPTGKPLNSRSIRVRHQVEEYDINWDTGSIEHYEPIEPLQLTEEPDEPTEELLNEEEFLSEVIDEPEDKVDPLIRESLLSITASVKNKDPLTPLAREFDSLDALVKDYNLFKSRTQTQLGTLGGGGATWLKDLDDVDLRSYDIQDGDVITFDSVTGKWIPDAVPSSTGVQSVNGEDGVVVLDAADVGADPTGTAAGLISAHESDTTPHTTITNLTKLGFNVNAGAVAGEGEIVWNNTDDTLDIGLPGGVTLQVGQERFIRFTNRTGSTLLNGKVVYITGAQGNRVTCAYADADQTSAEKTIAVLTQDVLNNQEGFATCEGLVRDIDTSAFSEGQELWLSTTAGNISSTPPAAPNHTVRIGYCVRSHATVGSIFVSVQTGGDLKHLHDVNITNLSDNQVLVYDSSTLTWLNEANNNHTHPSSSITFVEATANTATYSVSATTDYVGVTYADITTISLPVSPTVGHKVTIKDENGTAATKPITIQPGVGSSYNNIDKQSSITIAIAYGAATLICTTNGWRLV